QQLPHPHRADTFNHVERDKRLRGIHDGEKLKEKPSREQAEFHEESALDTKHPKQHKSSKDKPDHYQ
ncbi:MAG: hypothetical protein ACO1QS_16970, partial [Verrucomicrobiota bacterium]